MMQERSVTLYADPGERRASNLGTVFLHPRPRLHASFFITPRAAAITFGSSLYSFDHRSEIAMQGDHNQNIMLFYIHSGAMELTLGSVRALAAAGQVVLFDCREPYRYAASDGLEFSWLLFNGLNTHAFYRRILQAHGGRQVFMPSGVSEIAQLLDSIFTGCAADERPGEAQLSQMLHRMLGLLLLDDTSPAHAGSDRIAEAIRYMNRHLFEELSVQEVAASVALSSSHFSRQFKAKTGYPPYEYIILRRIDKAKYLLTLDPALGQGDRLCHRLQQRGKLHPQLPQQRRHRPRPVPEAPDLTEKEQGVYLSLALVQLCGIALTNWNLFNLLTSFSLQTWKLTLLQFLRANIPTHIK